MRCQQRLGVALAVLALPAGAAAQQDDAAPPPDLEFLEYLGSWQEQDEEWFVEAEIDDRHPADPHDRKPKRDLNNDE